ncbi:MAG: right-handed parallel beta-helix repeat-containing protein [Phycisphaerae bacterium]|nr:right-handed parallel beta-helix repeat-containing protein [Phycisphaerae bacterium]
MKPAMILAPMIASMMTGAGIWAAEYYVAPDGSDANPGTKAKPMRTLKRAAESVEPGDTCLVRSGTYRETIRFRGSGQPGRPIRFTAAPGETVVLSGTQRIAGPWKVYKGKIHQARVKSDFIQLFVDGRMMVEARWPNMQFPEDLWDRSRWARARTGSCYGKLVDPELAKTGIDWTGGRATLNVAHQFFTWTRTVSKHGAGEEAFEYAKDLEGITHYAKHAKGWEDDRYYLSGKLEALDSPGEWFLDTKTRTLYLWTLDGSDPGEHKVEAKVRNYGIDAAGVDHVQISGLHFFGATLRLEKCNHCAVEDCHLLYPTFARRISDPQTREEWVDQTCVVGSHNVVRRCSLVFSPTSGLMMRGSHNVAEDNLIRDICWYGSLRDVPLRMSLAESEQVGGGLARHNTVHHFGNAGICVYGGRFVVEYNHVYSGGLACKDVSLVYTHLPTCAGTIIHHNWVHGCRTELDKGLGIRGDDQTRGLTVHHNVVWDCGRDGIIVKGDSNKVHNNTVLQIGEPDKPGNYISLHTQPEPKKPWRKQWPLLKTQNAHSEILNNAALTITGHVKGTPFPAGKNIGNNYQGKDPQLVNPNELDFRPRSGSPLIDAGREIPGITDGFKGKAPDIGAYEFGGEDWRAGITWNPGRD